MLTHLSFTTAQWSVGITVILILNGDTQALKVLIIYAGFTATNDRVRTWTKAVWFQSMVFEVIMFVLHGNGIHKENVKGTVVKVKKKKKNVFWS